jgi:hypothetical protein
MAIIGNYIEKNSRIYRICGLSRGSYIVTDYNSTIMTTVPDVVSNIIHKSDIIVLYKESGECWAKKRL